MNKEKDEFKKLNTDQLKEKIENLRRDLFSLKLTTATSHVKDYSQFKKLKKNLARALTYLNQNNLGK